MSQHILTVTIDDPEDLIESGEIAQRVVEGILLVKGDSIAENCDFDVQYQETVVPEPRRDPDNLGVNQRGALQSLREHKKWHNKGFGCGWVWDNPSNTKAILDSLVKRDLVQVKEGVYTPV